MSFVASQRDVEIIIKNLEKRVLIQLENCELVQSRLLSIEFIYEYSEQSPS